MSISYNSDNKYPAEIYEPRRTDRAYVHVIYGSELPEWTFDSHGNPYGWWDSPINYGNNPRLLYDIRRTLELRQDNVERGDLIYFLPFVHWSDNGKFFFDGINVLPLYFDEGLGLFSIPSTFKIITEFPPRYWADRIHNNWVPFDIECLFGTIVPKEIHYVEKCYRWHCYFLFKSDAEIFAITHSVHIPMTPRGFRDRLQSMKYMYVSSIPDELDLLPIPNPENAFYIG